MICSNRIHSIVAELINEDCSVKEKVEITGLSGNNIYGIRINGSEVLLDINSYKIIELRKMYGNRFTEIIPHINSKLAEKHIRQALKSMWELSEDSELLRSWLSKEGVKIKFVWVKKNNITKDISGDISRAVLYGDGELKIFCTDKLDTFTFSSRQAYVKEITIFKLLGNSWEAVATTMFPLFFDKQKSYIDSLVVMLDNNMTISNLNNTASVQQYQNNWEDYEDLYWGYEHFSHAVKVDNFRKTFMYESGDNNGNKPH